MFGIFGKNNSLKHAEANLIREFGLTLDHDVPGKESIVENFNRMSNSARLSPEAQTSLLYRLVVLNHLVACKIMRDKGQNLDGIELGWLNIILERSFDWSGIAKDQIELEDVACHLNKNIVEFFKSFKTQSPQTIAITKASSSQQAASKEIVSPTKTKWHTQADNELETGCFDEKLWREVLVFAHNDKVRARILYAEKRAPILKNENTPVKDTGPSSGLSVPRQGSAQANSILSQPEHIQRRRLGELMSIPWRDRTDEQLDELIEIELGLGLGKAKRAREANL
jgi:hypothetical protein